MKIFYMKQLLISSRYVNPSHFHDPVGFPGLAPIKRECLFPLCRGGGDLRPNKPDADRPSSILIVAVEFPTPVLESARDRRRQSAVPVRHPVQRPFFRFPVEQTQRCAGVALGRKVRFVNVADTAQYRVHSQLGGELVPLFAAAETGLESAIPNIPFSNQEIEVMNTGFDRIGFLQGTLSFAGSRYRSMISCK